ncbi:MAG: hypothetical protein AUJ92_17490 [Armatimonadetes bacterium CG2_30_59_28]|nr:DUF2157 domain-containing protein [Armatimonadota bacterium]OIO90969.1 MAG: hypothetical protein AUJ92_17490 [Armatimonadetes bacterium CG2_30_59_28]PIU67164.1 MAG: hypothetical protein COS85_01795 [Armatimonadetes bacterium CG07_land_8_20_14_0_80_59_28]PIX38874.1 MAG: hypothetical protein COZ56_19305 [Armatimonadetes bacterium CG_4_8_14_3_um_filter_58_9]PIY38565.1 MAG: hypothetical protein COZ05_20615 [Armatimonadetes bacterium CG_4_10_14_3_um_filter_59_10]PJB71270.1 MAG: hypothetical prot
MPMTEKDFQKRLAREVSQWRLDHLISDSQATAILDRYGVDGREIVRSRMAVLLAFLGASLLGLGVILFFAANWETMPRWSKLALVVFSVVASYQTGFHLRYRRPDFHKTGSALLYLGAFLYGAAIFLIAQGYHVNADEPLLLALWAAGVLPMAYLLGSLPMVALGVTCLGVAFHWELAYWAAFDGSVLHHCSGMLVFGVLLYAVSLLHGLSEDGASHRRLYGILGLVSVLATMLVLSFAEVHHWRGDGHSLRQLPDRVVIGFWVLLGGTVCTTVTALLLQRASTSAVRAEAVMLIGSLVMAILLFCGRTGNGNGTAIAFNLMLLCFTLGTIWVGVAVRESGWVNLGLSVFALHAIARYCDWFWDMLPQSLFFMSAGVLLLAGGMCLERTRRRIIADFSS